MALLAKKIQIKIHFNNQYRNNAKWQVQKQCSAFQLDHNGHGN